MKIQDIRKRLHIDCEKCCGLCCVAFYCAKIDGFPKDKKPGVPCIFLDKQYMCEKHDALAKDKRKGCLSFDCFGAGQATTQLYKGKTWMDHEVNKEEMYQVFYTFMKLHQSVWYLLEAYEKASHSQIKEKVEALLELYEKLQYEYVPEFLSLDINLFQKNANEVLKGFSKEVLLKYKKKPQSKKDFIGKDMRNTRVIAEDFTMAFLMAANFENCDLKYANFLGADLRDANIKGSDLSKSLFLTQMQINSCQGNEHTQLPPYIDMPTHWRH